MNRMNHRVSYIVPNALKNSMEPILLELAWGGRFQGFPPFDGEEFGYVIQGRLCFIMATGNLL